MSYLQHIQGLMKTAQGALGDEWEVLDYRRFSKTDNDAFKNGKWLCEIERLNIERDIEGDLLRVITQWEIDLSQPQSMSDTVIQQRTRALNVGLDALNTAFITDTRLRGEGMFMQIGDGASGGLQVTGEGLIERRGSLTVVGALTLLPTMHYERFEA